MLRLTSLLSLFVFFVACAPQKLLEKGKPEKAFARAAAQAERNADAKTSTLEALATSYAILQYADYEQVTRLGNSNSPSRWEGMVDMLERLEARRRRVDAIRRNVKRIIRIDEVSEPPYASELVVAKREAAAHLLRQGKNLLALGENGDLLAAREAYNSFEKRDRYAPRTASINDLSKRAKYLGTIRVALDVRGSVSDRTLDQLGLAAERRLRRPWVEVYPLHTRGTSEAHMIAELDVAEPYVSPLARDESRERFEKTITERTKVAVDTAGSPIYKVVEKKVRATVVTRSVFRESSVSARLTFFNAATGREIKRRDFNGVYVFEDFSSRIKGDRKALGDFCPANLNNILSSPPSIFAMEDAALEALCTAIPNLNLDRAIDKAAFVAR